MNNIVYIFLSIVHIYSILFTKIRVVQAASTSASLCVSVQLEQASLRAQSQGTGISCKVAVPPASLLWHSQSLRRPGQEGRRHRHHCSGSLASLCRRPGACAWPGKIISTTWLLGPGLLSPSTPVWKYFIWASLALPGLRLAGLPFISLNCCKLGNSLAPMPR